MRVAGPFGYRRGLLSPLRDAVLSSTAGRDARLDWTIAAKLFAALFAIMNPLSVIPVYLALTADQAPEERRAASLMMIATVVTGAAVCAIAGQGLLSIFGIDVPHFRLAGGVIVLLIALSMLSGEEHSSHAGTTEEQKDFRSAASVGMYPLAIPITLGPGTMATIIVFAQSATAPSSFLGYYTGLIGYLVFFQRDDSDSARDFGVDVTNRTQRVKAPHGHHSCRHCGRDDHGSPVANISSLGGVMAAPCQHRDSHRSFRRSCFFDDHLGRI